MDTVIMGKLVVVLLLTIVAIITTAYTKNTWFSDDVLPVLAKVLFMPMWFVAIYGATRILQQLV